ncbi:MAG: hypothetical protein HOH92_03000 [Crocinitomicaceae bacterium]|nr:hypothetical protein [Crocinitomicaceae bacterium]
MEERKQKSEGLEQSSEEGMSVVSHRSGGVTIDVNQHAIDVSIKPKIPFFVKNQGNTARQMK